MSVIQLRRPARLPSPRQRSVVTTVVGEKLFIDPATASESIFRAMPETDAVFSELPAETDVAIVIPGEEVDQADIEVLDEDAQLFGSEGPPYVLRSRVS